MGTVFLMDGTAYNVKVLELTRKFAVLDEETSGRTTDKNMHRDIVGTFYNYSMVLAPDHTDLDAYDRFYEAVTDPSRESHEMIFPYAQETLTFRAYVSQGEDKLKIRNGRNLWGASDGISLNFTAMEPQRRR